MDHKCLLHEPEISFVYADFFNQKIFISMSLFDSFLQGHKLAEILIEGHNPDARLKLTTPDVDALRQHMTTGEALRAYVTGRIVGSGPGVWVVTERQVLMRDAVKQMVIRLHASDVAHVETLRGRYGHTVRLSAHGAHYSMFGVDVALAREMHQAFQALGVSSAFEDKPPSTGIGKFTPVLT